MGIKGKFNGKENAVDGGPLLTGMVVCLTSSTQTALGHCACQDPIWGILKLAGSFLVSDISMALFSLSSSQQLWDLLSLTHVAYSSDDLLIICQAPLESRSRGAQMKNIDGMSLSTLLSNVLFSIIKKFFGK